MSKTPGHMVRILCVGPFNNYYFKDETFVVLESLPGRCPCKLISSSLDLETVTWRKECKDVHKHHLKPVRMTTGEAERGLEILNQYREWVDRQSIDLR